MTATRYVQLTKTTERGHQWLVDNVGQVVDRVDQMHVKVFFIKAKVTVICAEANLEETEDTDAE